MIDILKQSQHAFENICELVYDPENENAPYKTLSQDAVKQIHFEAAEMLVSLEQIINQLELRSALERIAKEPLLEDTENENEWKNDNFHPLPEPGSDEFELVVKLARKTLINLNSQIFPDFDESKR